MWPHPPMYCVRYTIRGCQVGGIIAVVGHTHNVKLIVVRCPLSSKHSISIGHFDSEPFTFQEETKNTQVRQICTLQHL